MGANRIWRMRAPRRVARRLTENVAHEAALGSGYNQY